jgi:hypothetical protein
MKTSIEKPAQKGEKRMPLINIASYKRNWGHRLAVALFLVLATAGLAAQGADAPTPWLKGYVKTISGERFGYHSPYPDIGNALLVRATDGEMRIAWETEPVPAGLKPGSATFLWMAGIASRRGAHRFYLSVDGEPLLTFRSAADPSQKSWTVTGRGGASLAFRATMVDAAEDLLGYMTLTMPAPLLKAGRPLRLEIRGEKAGNRDWAMVFEHSLEASVSARSEQVLVKKDGRTRQIVGVEISRPGPPARAAVAIEGAVERVRLETGYNIVFIPVAPAAADREASLTVDYGRGRIERRTVRIRPVVRRDLYFLPHSHVDIGYSDRQSVVERNHWSYYERAIELAAKTADYPAGARFKWNVEELWAVETYLKQASPEKRAAFVGAVRKGWIGLQAMLSNQLTGLCHPEEFLRLTAFGRILGAECGVPVRSAMITDIPGLSWAAVAAFARAGVAYFSSGPNYMPRLIDGGDRIGRTLKAWGDRPFYWVSPSGDAKILFWMAGRGYSWFHGLNLGDLGRAPVRGILDYMLELADRGYPYSMVQVRYTVGGDNGPPDPGLADFVRRWNEEHESPRIVIATAEEAFAELERRYGAIIPAVRGDFTGYWEDGAASTARETALARRSAERLVEAETLWSLLDPARFPAAAFDEAWRQVVLFNEHTWGAADSISDPDGENARDQWAYKQAFALEADRMSRKLRASALSVPGPAEAKAGRLAVDVVNTLSWPRSELATLSAEVPRPGDAVRDADGRPVPSQRLSTGDLVFLAADVPALGAKRFVVTAGAQQAAGHASVADGRLENGLATVSIDPVTGAAKSYQWAFGRDLELADTAAPFGLNAYFYIPGRDPSKAQGPSNVKFRSGEAGPLVASLVVESDAPGTKRLVREYILRDGSPRLEIRNLVDKTKVRDKESVHFGFPLGVPDGEMRIDLGWAEIRPEADQLPGACRDFFGIRDSIDVSNRDYGVVWVSPDAPLAEAGAMTDETPGPLGTRGWRERIGPTRTIFSYAMNNYWHTNYKADQEGEVELRYALIPHAGFERAAVKRLGAEAVRPLVAVASSGDRPLARSPLAVSSGAIVVSSLRPAPGGAGWIVRLYNASGRPETFEVKGASEVSAIAVGDVDGNPVGPLSGPVTLAGHGLITLRLDRRQ